MSDFLKKTLNIKEPLFSSGLAALEKSTGNSGIDIRLIADVLEKAHKVMRALGLDPADTTGHELYYSQVAAVKRSDIETLLFGMDYVLYIIDGKVVSFNLIDVIENSHHELPFEKRIISHGQRSLRGEIIGRYAKHSRTDKNTTLEIASMIGLSPGRKACYNNAKANKKQDIQKSRGSAG